jgi:hypothetical protein
VSLRNKRLDWSPDDDEMLRRLAAEGVSRLQIALKLKRTEAAVRSRACKLGIRFKRKARFRFDSLAH